MHTVKADLQRACHPGVPYQQSEWDTRAVVRQLVEAPGVWAVLEYRFRRWTLRQPRPARVILRLCGLLVHKPVELVTGISIDTAATFGAGLYIGHWGGIVVGPDVVVGENCNLSQGVTLGDHNGSPRVGNDVFFAAGAVAFGPIQIGDGVSVGANAVVNRDVPANSTAVGVPARAIPKRGAATAP